MKNFIRFLLFVLVAGAFLNSCETTELDLRSSPNGLAPDQGDPNYLLNNIQLEYATSLSVLSDLSGALVRIDQLACGDYFNCLPGSTLNGTWTRTYSNILPDLQNLETQDAGTGDLAFHIAVGKTLYAHSLILLVDFIGEAAFSQAGNPVEFPAPQLDDGELVYREALNLLDEAETVFESNPNPQGATDIYYDEDASKWIKLINTIRLKAFYTTNNQAAFAQIIAGDNYIKDPEDDFFLKYGTSELQPDDRHPDYAFDYTPSGAGIYQSNWLMELMLNNGDPRIRYYFYRQVAATPGVDAPPDENVLGLCGFAQPPQHYIDAGFTVCPPPNGYWGRGHGWAGGIPPDNFLRTAVGVYPAGGRFDDNSFDGVGLGLGGGGAGIEPIIMSSYVDFWRGYMASSDADRANFLRSGLEKSIATVQRFGALDPNADRSFEPTPDAVASYINDVISAFNAGTADEKENIFAEQYLTSLYGGSSEAWTYYRLTGYPTTLMPMLNPSPGPFPRTLQYPQNEVVNNPNLQQKNTLTEQVFWDTNPPSPAFPKAN